MKHDPPWAQINNLCIIVAVEYELDRALKWQCYKFDTCLSSQSVPASDAAAEAAVFCHTYTEPREAAAAGPPPAQTLQLHPQSVLNSSSQPDTRPFWLPSRSDGKRWPLTFMEEQRHLIEAIRVWRNFVNDLHLYVCRSIMCPVH